MSSMDAESAASEPIAVVGVSCRLPGADGPARFWELLCGGEDAIGDVPGGRWPDADRTEFRRGGFLPDVDKFDAAFFGISPREAAAMDPQQRLFLELTWEALEHARITPAELRDTPAAVFAGVITGDYALLHDRLGAEVPGPHVLTGTHRSLVANRVSYLLGLRGPSLTLDSGQSSSLVAVQLACDELRRGTARVALAGGVNLNLLAETSAVLGGFGALSPDGRCHTFDSRANGYVRGEGGGVVVLKPLSDALADGDRVLSVILGGAITNDGGGDSLTVPHARAQEETIRLACRRAGVAPAEVGYVELHGTGTRVGDPIEAAALGTALGAGREEPLLVGSVKTVIGHLEGAAGIAGLLKVVLSLRHRVLPPSLNFVSPNPDIPLEELNLDVVRETREWPSERLVAGVSSFGIGGTNCHLVLTEPPSAPEAEPTTTVAPLVLSARSAAALRSQAAKLTSHPNDDLADVAYSLVHSRALFEHRAVVLGDDRAALLAGLDDLAQGRPAESVVTGRAVDGTNVMVFPGQGSQWPAMARELLTTSTVFAQKLTECCDALKQFLDYPLLDRLRDGTPELGRVEVVQPALWAVMVALAEVWRDRGVEPGMVIGHSQGEVAAATAIGALSLEDGARVIALRSQSAKRRAGGGMMSVGAAPDVVEKYLTDGISIAVVNGPRSVVLSGTVDALTELQPSFAEFRTKMLPVEYASHSPAVDPLRDELLEALATLRPRSTDAVFVSTVTGEALDTAELDAGYWFRNLRCPVRFADATRYALAAGATRFVECSTHPALLASVEETAEEAGRDVAVAGTLRRDDGGPDRIARSAAEAFVGGTPIAWDVAGRLTDLPTYAFQRERHWLGETKAREITTTASGPELAPVATTSRKELRDLVLGAAAAVLGHADAAALDAAWTFKDLGFDSVSVVELRTRIQALTGLRLPTTLLFDFPTPAHVVDTLHERLSGGTRDVEESLQVKDNDPIAIVAIGCRYPGDITSPEDFWRIVATGTDAITELPTNRGWDLDQLFGSDTAAGTCATRFGGFVHDADTFDAAFFGLSPREALAMDPQQRLLLETCWEAVERGGIDPESLRGSATGVFVGAMTTDYGPPLHQPTGVVDGHRLTGTALSVASGRIAYTFGLTGPAFTVDTACSSSLVAIQLATESLRRGECALALAGGVTLMSNPGNLVDFSRQNGLSADGRAKAFSASADGTAFAEGAGILLLERLSDARRNGHPVLAVVRGAAVNSDGASNGLTAPNGQAQQQVIRRALSDAGLSTQDVDVVEAHGTGTALGDPIEAHALLETYGQDRETPLWLGSVKSNIGHTQAAAGVAGVIKMILAMRHETLPRTLHADEPSAKISWEDGDVRLLTAEQPWPADRPRRAAVSSFGISGTNAHVILESVSTVDVAADGELVWVLSARSDAALRAQAARLRAFATEASDDDLAAAGALLVRRRTFASRAVVIAADRAELDDALAALADGTPHPAVTTGTAAREARPVFVFPGQGAQWAGMAADLLATDEIFARHLTACADALAPHTGWSLLDVLTGAEGAPTLEGTEVVQPALFAVMVALAQRWRAAGVEPAAVVGHSQGEIAAAVIAGALPLEEAARIIARRSRIITEVLDGTGGILAVGLPASEVRLRIEPWAGKLWIAVDNGPVGTVIGGDLDAIEEFAAGCEEGVQLRRTPVAYAAHTPHVEAVREQLLELIGELSPVDTEIAICSACTGDFITGSELTPEYWYRNLAEQVSFDTAIRAFRDYPRPLFVEVSPHPILAGAVQEILADAGIDGGAVGTLRRGKGGRHQFLTAVAAAYVRGAGVAWTELLGPVRRHVDLPTYAFDRERYWLTNSTTLFDTVPVADGGFLLTGRVSRAAMPWLSDHAVRGTVLLPGTAFLEFALQAAAAADCDEVEDLTLHAPLVLTGPTQIQVLVGADEGGRRTLTVHSRRDDEEWTQHASGFLATAAPAQPERLGAWPLGEPIDLTGCYERLAALGYEYGPAFQGLTAAWRDGDDVYAEVKLPVDAGDFILHPALLDAALHVLVLESTELVLPFSWSGVRANLSGVDAVRVRLSGSSVTLYDTTGTVVACAESLTLRPAGALSSAELYTVDWVEIPADDTHEWAVLDDLTTFPAAQTVLVPELPGDVRETLHTTLSLIQRWLDHSADARLVFTADHRTLPGAAIWGLVRSAIAEHPGRFALAALSRESAGLLSAALASGEPQFRIDGERVLVPRLARRRVDESTVDFEGGTVLVTGGTSGLGALVAERLAERHGVQHLLLVSRSGEDAPGVPELVERLENHGAKVRVAACDVADRDDLTALLAEAGPLAGVVHAAGVLDDATVAGLTAVQVENVLRPKLDAALLLDELTADHPIKAFVLFSSVAAVLGNRGQGNYAAANAALDALAVQRREQGLPGVSIAWGLWSVATGMTAGMSDTDRARLTGVTPITGDQGLAMFDAALGAEGHLVASRWNLTDDVPAVLRSFVRTPRKVATTTTEESGLASQLANLDRTEASAVLTEFVRRQVAVALGHRSPGTVEADKPFSELGIDSLTSVELRNRIGAETGLRLPASLLFNHPTVALLTGHLLDELAPATPEPGDVLREQLDQALTGLGHERLVAELRDALERLGEPAGGLELASDEEIFAFIDTQL